MEIALLIPPILAAALGVCPARLGRALRPPLAVRLLPLAGVAVAMGTGFSLTVLALFLLARAAALASVGHWSAAALPSPADLPWPLGVPVAGVVVLLLAAAAVHTTRAGHRLWLADGLCRRLAPTLDDQRTVVIDDDEPDAYAVGAIHGRIVISTAMIAALGDSERRVLLAHEAAHLAHRHHLWIQLAEIAAAANPLLRQLPAAVRLAAERWADEDAAAAVGDRRVAAFAIARAALARAGARQRRLTRPDLPVLAASGSDVPRRVQALLHPPSLRWSGVLTAILVAMIAGVLTATTITAHTTEQQFEHAKSLDTSMLSAPGR
jgi:hypothetical protein